MRISKGPNVSWTEIRAKLGKTDPPDFLVDVYYDLRERRLLPLLGLVAVAIAAVPFLLGDPEEVPPPEVREAAVAAAAEAGSEIPGASGLVVVEARPGLRDYRKRLRGRTPSDPFVQKYTGVPRKSQLRSVPPPEGEGGVGGAPETGGGGETGTEGGEGGTSPEGGGTPPSSGGSGGEKPDGGGEKPRGKQPAGKAKPRLFEFLLTVWTATSRKTADGGREADDPVRRRVLPLTPLPGRKATVVTTLGVNLRNGKAMFLVSDGVSKVGGEFRCVARSEGACDLLEVTPGFPLAFVYGPHEVRYRLKVTNIDIVPARRTAGRRAGSSAADGAFAAP